MPDRLRLVMSLYYYNELNFKEIGRVLDLTESRISQLHSEAVKYLRSALKSGLTLFSGAKLIEFLLLISLCF